MFDVKNQGKMRQCEWIDEARRGERCSHLVLINDNLKNDESNWFVEIFLKILFKFYKI